MMSLKELPTTLLETLANNWVEQAKVSDLKPSTKTHDKFERLYWIGVFQTLTTLGYQPSPIIYICLQSGRSTSATILKAKVERERKTAQDQLSVAPNPEVQVEVALE